ncbi:interleukin-17F [Dama dama]|uniref:interleukin-17F n=1 Tax=Dama dama TaxID=30532 RepID=UPI002A35D83B|nr:interleukin-17F [Dama dama]
MTVLCDTAVVKSLLLLTLGLTLLGEGEARKPPKSGDPGLCPPLEDHTVRVDIRIRRQSQGSLLSHNLQNRSISPWDYNITRDPNRFPSEIAEAQCRHTGCINAQGEEDWSLNSVPIQQELLVLRREPQGCPGLFRLEKVLVTVGCTCVTPVVRHVGDSRVADQLS